MTLKEFNRFPIFLLWSFLTSVQLIAQVAVRGSVLDKENQIPLQGVEIFLAGSETRSTTTDAKGNFAIQNVPQGNYILHVFLLDYETISQQLEATVDSYLTFGLEPLSTELTAVVIERQAEKLFGIKRLNPVEGTAIYDAKKTEVVLLDQTIGNLAANNPRTIFGKVVGLNMYENGDAGLQLNVGGRGLDPNRTSNFNTRQNGYDISADVLGYPESYYTPPAEALDQIQVVRGAASLQYGTQFGGLINFIFKKPNPRKKLEWTSRQSIGSYGLLTSFNSMSGVFNKTGYYTYFNYKRGDGFRPNSKFDSRNYYANIRHQLSEQTKLTFDFTFLDYLAQQSGGLTDEQMEADIYQSNRSRNWFAVEWLLFSTRIDHKFNSKSDLSVNFFGLDASRSSLGFRGIPGFLNFNPITVDDEVNEDGDYIHPRDLIYGEFNNWGIETRFLTRYTIGEKMSVFLIGNKIYKSANSIRQGAASSGTDADFSFMNNEFPGYPYQSDFDFPNFNSAFFMENIFYLNEKISITPGLRFEHIKTESVGSYLDITYGLGNQLLESIQRTDNREFVRDFLLTGIGMSFQGSDFLELYANVSQNYRSVTFSDIRVVNPSFVIDPNIRDEKGYTSDIGIRGKLDKALSFDVNLFYVGYKDRIGAVLDDRARMNRTNVGDALIYGIEAFSEWNVINTLKWDADRYLWSMFINAAWTHSEYLASELNNILGKQVEFVPMVNFKSGFKFGFNNLLINLQFTYLSSQYSDAENSGLPSTSSNQYGMLGAIPAYKILDLGLTYQLKKIKVEFGINNLLNENYFTRRATGYPGPGIIPSEPRNLYLTLEIKI